jgi:hypothetical protein
MIFHKHTLWQDDTAKPGFRYLRNKLKQICCSLLLKIQCWAMSLEKIQRLAAKMIATNPAGRGLLLIGGFRYRLINQSTRVSQDIAFHWAGDLDEKQEELVELCSRILIPEVRRDLGFEGRASKASGPEAASPRARFIDLRFWKPNVPESGIELPIELTQIICLDGVMVKTVGGVVYPTASDADLIESKIIAVFGRIFIAHRDLVDLFLFADSLLPNSPERIAQKLLNFDPASIAQRFEDFEAHGSYHAAAVQKVIDSQVESVVATQLNSAGGGKMVFKSALEILRKTVLKK